MSCGVSSSDNCNGMDQDNSSQDLMEIKQSPVRSPGSPVLLSSSPMILEPREKAQGGEFSYHLVIYQGGNYDDIKLDKYFP